MKTPGAKLTNHQRLEALAVRPIPPPFSDKLESVRRIIGEMRAEAKKNWRESRIHARREISWRYWRNHLQGAFRSELAFDPN